MPRTPRILAPWVGQPGADPAIYHCVSRVVDRKFVFGPPEKEEFLRLMRLYERFCGVRVLTHCVMSNHFHLLLEVPPRPEGGLSDRDLCLRLAVLYSDAEVEKTRALLARYREDGNTADAEALREKHLYRMWDLGQFMKSLKQRFTRWFNTRHGRRGTLWEERYKNVLVEDGHAARVMGAYIDLNPLRAGMVGRPEDYRWCGYAEAMAGKPPARAGIGRVMEHYERLAGGQRDQRPWPEIIAAYRVILFHDGEERQREDAATGEITMARRGISREEVAKVLAGGGKIGAGQMLRCRVRAMSDGAVLGTGEFVESFFQAKREHFGPKRKTGARPIHGCETELCCARGLRKDALG